MNKYGCQNTGDSLRVNVGIQINLVFMLYFIRICAKSIGSRCHMDRKTKHQTLTRTCRKNLVPSTNSEKLIGLKHQSKELFLKTMQTKLKKKKRKDTSRSPQIELKRKKIQCWMFLTQEQENWLLTISKTIKVVTTLQPTTSDWRDLIKCPPRWARITSAMKDVPCHSLTSHQLMTSSKDNHMKTFVDQIL